MNNWLLGLMTAMLASFLAQVIYVTVDNHIAAAVINLVVNGPILYGSYLLAKRNLNE
jgi:hypothetical protein